MLDATKNWSNLSLLWQHTCECGNDLSARNRSIDRYNWLICNCGNITKPNVFICFSVRLNCVWNLNFFFFELLIDHNYKWIECTQMNWVLYTTEAQMNSIAVSFFFAQLISNADMHVTVIQTKLKKQQLLPTPSRWELKTFFHFLLAGWFFFLSKKKKPNSQFERASIMLITFIYY